MLGGGPGPEGSTIIATERKHRSVDTDSVTVGGGVHGDIDGGVVGVGEDGALVDGEIRVGVTEHQRGDAAALQLLAQAASERDSDVFLEESVAERLSVVVAAVAGID